jgi:hypothetical protein
MRRLFRAMKEAADGLPEVGPSARKLGIRRGDQTPCDVAASTPSDIVGPGDGGLSVAPGDPAFLIRHRRPASLGGTGTDPVWVIELADLSPDLTARQDSPKHVVVEAAIPMALADFEDLIAATRVEWKVYAR